MGLSDVAGIFSRAFVVGYFIPAFFALMVLRLAAAPDSLPTNFEALKGATEILVVGAVALFAGLLLWGLHYPILRVFEGYPLEEQRDWKPKLLLGLKPVKPLYELAIRRQRNRFAPLKAAAESPDRSPRRSAAAKELDTFWPATSDALLPTRFGNALRAFERHPRSRYNLNGIYAYPRIAALLNEAEREAVTEARTDVAFFVNSALLALLVLATLTVDAVVQDWIATGWFVATVAGAVAVCLSAYRAAVLAGVRWGSTVRASFDLHRFELYEAMGMKRPESPQEERAIAEAVNRCFVYALPLPGELWAPNDPDPTEEETP